MFSMHYFPDKKLRLSQVMDMIGIIVNDVLGLANKFMCSFLIKTIRIRFPSCDTFIITSGLIQLFSNSLHCPQINIQTL